MANEKRLIDANELLLSIRTTIVRSKYKYSKNPIISTVLDGFDELVIGKVKNAPTVDAVEVVRCKDCFFIGWRGTNTNDCGYFYCRHPSGLKVIKNAHTSFCDFGKRREG